MPTSESHVSDITCPPSSDLRAEFVPSWTPDARTARDDARSKHAALIGSEEVWRPIPPPSTEGDLLKQHDRVTPPPPCPPARKQAQDPLGRRGGRRGSLGPGGAPLSDGGRAVDEITRRSPPATAERARAALAALRSRRLLPLRS